MRIRVSIIVMNFRICTTRYLLINVSRYVGRVVRWHSQRERYFLELEKIVIFMVIKIFDWENHLKEGRNEHLWTLNFIVSFINWNSRSNNEPIITLKTAIIISQVSAINATVTHISNNNWKNENKYNSLGNLNQLKITFLFLLTTTAATTTSSSHGSS